MSTDRKRQRRTGRGKGHSFLALPHHMLKSPEFAALGYSATKLLLEIAMQFNGKNNGDLSATVTLLGERGWNSGVLIRAKEELIRSGFIVKTRQGGRHVCDLFGVTWLPIDRCDGKHDHPAETVPLNLWKKSVLPERSTLLHQRSTEPSGAVRAFSALELLRQRTPS
jgi:hypothetical protein